MSANFLTDILRWLAPILAMPGVILGIVCLLLAWTLWSGFWLGRASKKLKSAFDEAARNVSTSAGQIEFAQGYEAHSASIKKSKLLGPSWAAYSHTFVIPPSAGRPIIGTAEPRDWFDLAGLFRHAGADLRYHAALPGLLVGAGLIFTFLGLAAALTAASDVVAEGVSQVDRNTALRTLLGAASVKFITSLAGLALSILYALFRKSRIKAVEQAYASFAAALHKRIPFRTAAFLQAENTMVLEKLQVDAQTVGNDLFVKLGDRLADAFNAGLSEQIGPLAEALRDLQSKLTMQSADAMQGMTGAFLSRLEGAVGENMRATAASLDTLGTRLDGLQSGLEAAAGRMGAAAEEMAAGMGRGAADSVERLAAPIAALLAQMSDLAAGQRQAGAAAASELAETVARSAQALEATAARVADTLGGGAQDASARLIAATEAMRDDLRAMLERFGDTLGESGRALAQGAEAGGERLRGAAAAFGGDLEAAAATLREAGTAAGNALRTGGEQAQAGLTQSAGTLGAASGALADRLSALGAASATLSERTMALEQAARSVETPLATAAADLRAAGQSAQTAAAPLREAAGAFAAAVEGLTGASTSLAAAQREADQLGRRLGEAAERFAGVDEGLARTLRSLQEGLNGYRTSIAEFVDGMDKGFKESVQSLTVVARSLDDNLEDLVEKTNGRAR